MGMVSQVKIVCNLCKFPAKIFGSEEDANEAGWIGISTPCYYQDRVFYEQHICPSCVEKIKESMLENKKWSDVLYDIGRNY